MHLWLLRRQKTQHAERQPQGARQCIGTTSPLCVAQGAEMKNAHFLSHQEIFDCAVAHLHEQGCAALLPSGGGAYRGGYRGGSCNYGGCPVGSFIRARDYMSAMEGIPVRYLSRAENEVPAWMDVGVAALKKALLRAHINIYDPNTVDLLSCLQNVHDVFGVWEWHDRLLSIAAQFGLSPQRLQDAA